MRTRGRRTEALSCPVCRRSYVSMGICSSLEHAINQHVLRCSSRKHRRDVPVGESIKSQEGGVGVPTEVSSVSSDKELESGHNNYKVDQTRHYASTSDSNCGPSIKVACPISVAGNDQIGVVKDHLDGSANLAGSPVPSLSTERSDVTVISTSSIACPSPSRMDYTEVIAESARSTNSRSGAVHDGNGNKAPLCHSVDSCQTPQLQTMAVGSSIVKGNISHEQKACGSFQSSSRQECQGWKCTMCGHKFSSFSDKAIYAHILSCSNPSSKKSCAKHGKDRSQGKVVKKQKLSRLTNAKTSEMPRVPNRESKKSTTRAEKSVMKKGSTDRTEEKDQHQSGKKRSLCTNVVPLSNALRVRPGASELPTMKERNDNDRHMSTASTLSCASPAAAANLFSTNCSITMNGERGQTTLDNCGGTEMMRLPSHSLGPDKCMPENNDIPFSKSAPMQAIEKEGEKRRSTRKRKSLHPDGLKCPVCETVFHIMDMDEEEAQEKINRHVIRCSRKHSPVGNSFASPKKRSPRDFHRFANNREKRVEPKGDSLPRAKKTKRTTTDCKPNVVIGTYESKWHDVACTSGRSKRSALPSVNSKCPICQKVFHSMSTSVAEMNRHVLACSDAQRRASERAHEGFSSPFASSSSPLFKGRWKVEKTSAKPIFRAQKSPEEIQRTRTESLRSLTDDKTRNALEHILLRNMI